jgi:hypothetical protein
MKKYLKYLLKASVGGTIINAADPAVPYDINNHTTECGANVYNYKANTI